MPKAMTIERAAKILHRSVDSITPIELEAAALPPKVLATMYRMTDYDPAPAGMQQALEAHGLVDERGYLTNRGEAIVQAIAGF